MPRALDPPAVRGVVFDLDGTLVDSYRAIAESVNHARRAFDLGPLGDDAVRARVGHGLEQLVEDVLGPDRVEQGVHLFRTRYAEVFLDLTVALPGARETLEALRQAGLGLAIASNKPARFTRPILDRLGLAACVRYVHGPDTVGSTKPDPAMLLRCLSDLGILPSEALYVGDMLLDVTSAARAGVPVALVVGGSSDEAALRATGHTVLGALPALGDLLLRHRNKFPGVRT